MSSASMRTGPIFREAVGLARMVAVPTLPGLVLFALSVAGQGWVNMHVGQGGEPVFYWMLMGLVTIFAGCFWSATMYRRLLPEAGTRTVLADTSRLFAANLAVYGLFFILLFLLTLFFSIFAGVLIDAAGYDPSETGNSTEAVWASMRALSDSGGAAVLYGLLFASAAGLVWLGLRLFLFGVATVAERSLTIFRSWAWTSRHVAKIALLWLALQLFPWLVLSLVASGLLHLGGMTTVFTLYVGPQAGATQIGELQTVGLIGLAVLVMAPFYWLGHALAVSLYRRLAPNRVDAETTFG